MKSLLLILLIILTFKTSLTAQKNLIIYGQVINNKDSLPVFNSNIFLSGLGIGTTSNFEGQFKLVIPKENINNDIVISHIGYESIEVSLNYLIDTFHTIYLRPSISKLDEVIILSIDPLDVIKNVIKGMSNNYPSKKYTYDVFYKEIGRINNTYYRFQEVAASIYSEGFNIDYGGKKDYPIWVHGKRSSFNYFKNTDEQNGLFVIFWLNWAKYYFSKKALKNYIYEFVGEDIYENIEVYKISVTKKDKEGTTIIYVTKNNFAVVYIESNYINTKQTTPNGNSTWFSKEYKLVLSFRQIDNLWFINNILDCRYNGLKNDSTIQVSRSLQVNNITEGKLKLTHNITSQTDLFSFDVEYVEDFWRNFNAPLESEEETRIKIELERNGIKLQNQFKKVGF